MDCIDPNVGFQVPIWSWLEKHSLSCIVCMSLTTFGECWECVSVTCWMLSGINSIYIHYHGKQNIARQTESTWLSTAVHGRQWWELFMKLGLSSSRNQSCKSRCGLLSVPKSSEFVATARKIWLPVRGNKSHPANSVSFFGVQTNLYNAEFAFGYNWTKELA